MSSRKKVGMGGSTLEMVTTMAEGNPGALSVLIKMMQDKEMGFINVLNLDDMNMRGPQIWVAYRDFAGEDLGRFKVLCMDRDKDMVAKVNEVMGMDPGYHEHAVTSGASFEHT